jgi:hypothetical protein
MPISAEEGLAAHDQMDRIGTDHLQDSVSEALDTFHNDEATRP